MGSCQRSAVSDQARVDFIRDLGSFLHFFVFVFRPGFLMGRTLGPIR